MIRTTKPLRPAECCLSREDLLALLEESQDNSATQPLHWDHIESCVKCQARLEELAGEPEWWRETRDLLGTVTQAESEISVDGHSTNSPTDSLGPTITVPQPEHWGQTYGEMQGREFTRDVLPILQQMPDFKTAQELKERDHHAAAVSSLGTLGDYVLTGVIGWGGTGVVLSAFDKNLDRSVAIKILYPHLAARGSARRRFEREARSVASLSHPSIMPIHRVVADAGPPYLVLAHLRGGSLQDKIDREGPLELEASLSIAMQIADALAAAHRQGVVHRDVKPGNILLEEDGHRVVLSDFGLAQTLDEMQLTASGMIAGTPPYMSPEQAAGGAVDPRSDLFSLGSVLYAMWTGREPFRRRGIAATLVAVASAEKTPANRIRRDLPTWACNLLELLHAKDPDDRLAGAKDARKLLEACLAHSRAPNEYALPDRLHAEPHREVAKQADTKTTRQRFSQTHFLIAGLCITCVATALALSGLFQSDDATAKGEAQSKSNLDATANVEAYMRWDEQTQWEDQLWDNEFIQLERELMELENQLLTK
ncbi:MAG: serine/threonine-protein kinase [Planctomycetota bacterium]